MTIQDKVIGSLCAWRENRGGGVEGMHSIFNVLLNRAKRRSTSVYMEATRKLQFSSMTSAGDSQLVLYPVDTDPQWIAALDLAEQASNGTLTDITMGASLYYAPKSLVTYKGQAWMLPDGQVIPFPDNWNKAAVTYLCTIQGQVFFK